MNRMMIIAFMCSGIVISVQGMDTANSHQDYLLKRTFGYDSKEQKEREMQYASKRTQLVASIKNCPDAERKKELVKELMIIHMNFAASKPKVNRKEAADTVIRWFDYTCRIHDDENA